MLPISISLCSQWRTSGVLHELNHSAVHQNPRETLGVEVMHIFNAQCQLSSVMTLPEDSFRQLGSVVVKKEVRSWRGEPSGQALSWHTRRVCYTLLQC